MADCGFDVTVVAPQDHAVHRLNGLTAVRMGRSQAMALTTITRCIERWRPLLLIPSDETAIGYLRKLYARAIRGIGAEPQRMSELIEVSLGSPSAFVFGHQKSRFVSLAAAEGLLVPETAVVHSTHMLRRLIAKSNFPMVLKRDESFGGRGVRIVADADEAIRAFAELKASGGYLSALKQAVRKLDVAHLNRLWSTRPAICLQRYVNGRPANRAVVCWRGEVLAGLSVDVVQTGEATGPATVVRVIDSAEMTAATDRLVRRLGLSGFVGFDFVLEATTGRPYIIEMNARPTQICHLSLGAGTDMVGALSKRCGLAPRPRAPSVGARTIALFPQELWRDPQSEYLRSAHHDVPWNMPEFILAYDRPVASELPGWLDRARHYLRNAGRFIGHPMKSAPAIDGVGTLDSTPKSVASAQIPIM
jgi:glutathione synthase/RimK-type ligase-like ATP-grasp enzyme